MLGEAANEANESEKLEIDRRRSDGQRASQSQTIATQLDDVGMTAVQLLFKSSRIAAKRTLESAAGKVGKEEGICGGGGRGEGGD